MTMQNILAKEIVVAVRGLIVKRKNIYGNLCKSGAGGLNTIDFCNGLIASRIGGNALLLYLQYFFCDISLLIDYNNRQLSHLTIS